jgi:hypothetical protein
MLQRTDPTRLSVLVATVALMAVGHAGARGTVVNGAKGQTATRGVERGCGQVRLQVIRA